MELTDESFVIDTDPANESDLLGGPEDSFIKTMAKDTSVLLSHETGLNALLKVQHTDPLTVKMTPFKKDYVQQSNDESKPLGSANNQTPNGPLIQIEPATLSPQKRLNSLPVPRSPLSNSFTGTEPTSTKKATLLRSRSQESILVGRDRSQELIETSKPSCPLDFSVCEGDVSTVLPDTPGIRRHAHLLGKEHQLLSLSTRQASPRPPASSGHSPSKLHESQTSKLDVSILNDGDTSTFLPDTPGIRRHAHLLSKEHQLLGNGTGRRSPLSGGCASSPSRSQPNLAVQVDDVPDSSQSQASSPTEVVVRSRDETSPRADDDMQNALKAIDMTIAGDETKEQIEMPNFDIKSVRKARMPQHASTSSTEPSMSRLAQPAVCDTIKSKVASASLHAPSCGETTMYETLDLKTVLKRTSIMPKDFYQAGDESISELMKEDNPFIATEEEKERAMKRTL